MGDREGGERETDRQKQTIRQRDRQTDRQRDSDTKQPVHQRPSGEVWQLTIAKSRR